MRLAASLFWLAAAPAAAFLLPQAPARSSWLAGPETVARTGVTGRVRELRMGLNAASLMKQQNGGGSKGKGKGGGNKDDGQPRGNSVIDTNKREYIYQASGHGR
jgi:hypothetical protein